jgi:hypothetical protein
MSVCSPAVSRSRRAAVALVAVAALAGVLLLAYGPGFVGYDGVDALVWGSQLADGDKPDLEAPSSPTPHPVVNALTTALAPLGDGARTALMALSLIALAALGAAAFAFGRQLFGTAAGALLALIVVTRDLVVNGYYQALPDPAFLALVLAAATLVARDPRGERPWSVLGLLGLAGLIRPEAWLLGGAYAVWAGLRRAPRDRAVLLAAAAAPALTWMACDLALTGDALHSLHGTSSAAERIGRPREIGTALRSGPGYLLDILHPAVLWIGLAGAVAALFTFYERALLPFALLCLGLIGFGVLGVAGLPLLQRYFYVPAVAIALFAAVVLVGWRDLPPGRSRTAWMAAAAVAAVLLVAGAIDDVQRLDRLRDFTSERRRLESALQDAVQSPGARTALHDCPPVAVPDQLMTPLVAFWSGLRPGDDVNALRLGFLRGGSAVAPSRFARRPWTLDPRDSGRRGGRPPASFRPVGGNAAWGVYSAC